MVRASASSFCLTQQFHRRGLSAVAICKGVAPVGFNFFLFWLARYASSPSTIDPTLAKAVFVDFDLFLYTTNHDRSGDLRPFILVSLDKILDFRPFRKIKFIYAGTGDIGKVWDRGGWRRCVERVLTSSGCYCGHASKVKNVAHDIFLKNPRKENLLLLPAW